MTRNGQANRFVVADAGKPVVPSAYSAMWKSDVICPECGAGYHRIVLTSQGGNKGEFRCLTCDHVLEVFDGSLEVLIRLTEPPQKSRR
jgi:predicted Zn finger-like uncharacterized protein